MEFTKIILSLLGLVALTTGGEVALTNYCPSEGGKIKSFSVTNCNQLPCQFVRGKTYEAILTFSLGRNSSSLTIKCSGDPVYQGQMQPIASFAACDGLSEGAKCPIVKDNYYTYGTNVTIPPMTPRVYTVKCDIYDDQNAKQICVEGKAIINFM